jgi:NTP pyrophosphatase (non-canonical NTP hydrolase)
MTFNEYQEKAKLTAKYPVVAEPYVYPALGLAGETGEVLEKIKKIFRDEGGKITDEKRQELAKELGDILWYVATLARELGLSLDEVAQNNINKLFSRMDRGVLHGDGDNR